MVDDSKQRIGNSVAEIAEILRFRREHNNERILNESSTGVKPNDLVSFRNDRGEHLHGAVFRITRPQNSPPLPKDNEIFYIKVPGREDLHRCMASAVSAPRKFPPLITGRGPITTVQEAEEGLITRAAELEIARQQRHDDFYTQQARTEATEIAEALAEWWYGPDASKHEAAQVWVELKPRIDAAISKLSTQPALPGDLAGQDFPATLTGEALSRPPAAPPRTSALPGPSSRPAPKKSQP